MMASATMEGAGEYSSSLGDLVEPGGMEALLALEVPRPRASQLALLVYLLR